jgi:DNA-binding NarL/FixJ family response regulator
VLLADDHAAVAEQLRGVLEPEFEVAAMVGDGRALVEAADAIGPDVIVTDIEMPWLDGIAAAIMILRKHPETRIVIVTVHAEAELLQRALAAGALGYVLKFSADVELALAVRAALRGETHVSRGVRFSRIASETQLSPREGLAGSTSPGHVCPDRIEGARGLGSSS